MGSFILRNYLMRYGNGIDGAIIMGTGMQPKRAVRLGWLQASFLNALRGPKHVCKTMDRMLFGVYNSKFTAGPEDSGHWVSIDIENVKALQSDPLCNFVFTANGFKTLMQLILNLYDTEKLAQMPKDLPVFFISGQDDPVGDFGKSVEKVFHSFEELGMENVQMKLYPGDRHEILNEADKDQVYGDIYRFILQRIS